MASVNAFSAARVHQALAVGAFLGTEPWSGRVASVHPAAINVLREDGLLVSIVSEERSMTAMSILTASVFEPQPKGRSFRTLIGCPAECGYGRLLISGFAPIELSQGLIWEGRIRTDLGKAITVRNVLIMEQALTRIGKSGGLLGVLTPEASPNPYVTRAMRALAEDKPAALVGLGPGMTPAGDDFLAGALLAGGLFVGARLEGTLLAEAADHGGPGAGPYGGSGAAGLKAADRGGPGAGLCVGPGAAGMNAADIEAALPGTTPGGRTLLRLALWGSFPSYMCAFIERLASARTESEIQEAVGSACSHGETSGTDSLAGFCWMSRRR